MVPTDVEMIRCPAGFLLQARPRRLRFSGFFRPAGDGPVTAEEAADRLHPGRHADKQHVYQGDCDHGLHHHHDPMIVPRAVVVVECMAALTVLDLLMADMTSRMDRIQAFFRR